MCNRVWLHFNYNLAVAPARLRTAVDRALLQVYGSAGAALPAGLSPTPAPAEHLAALE